MDNNERIAQWEKMTQADPDNSMGWLSLGNAYKDAERFDDAEQAYRKTIEVDATMSRAYQLLGQVLIRLGKNEEAAETLTQGYPIAAERGDVMPMKAMGSLLEKIGKPVPKVEKAAPEPELTGDQIVDRRTGQAGHRLPDQPMRGPIGKFIYDHFTQETWREWIGMGTKVINELRLDLSNEQHQQVYEDHMLEWLGVNRDEIDQYSDQAGELPSQRD